MMSPARSASPNDTGERFPDLAQVRRLHVQKILGRPGVVARAGDRLRDFVRQRGSQFSHHAHAVHVGEIRLHLLQSRQRLCAILDVRQQNVPADNTPGVIANWDAAVVKPPIFAVEAPQALFDLVGNAGGDRFRENFSDVGKIFSDVPFRLFPSSSALPVTGRNTRGFGD